MLQGNGSAAPKSRSWDANLTSDCHLMKVVCSYSTPMQLCCIVTLGAANTLHVSLGLKCLWVTAVSWAGWLLLLAIWQIPLLALHFQLWSSSVCMRLLYWSLFNTHFALGCGIAAFLIELCCVDEFLGHRECCVCKCAGSAGSKGEGFCG